MENTVDIYNLLPEEINDVIRKLTTALEIVKCRKNTNSKFVDKEKEIIICPHCQSKRINHYLHKWLLCSIIYL